MKNRFCRHRRGAGAIAWCWGSRKLRRRGREDQWLCFILGVVVFGEELGGEVVVGDGHVGGDEGAGVL